MSEEDAAKIHERAVCYMMRYMVSAFSTFSDLKQFVTDETPLHPVVKTEVVPMKVLFRDEKYVSETIEILTDIAKDAQLLGQPQVSLHANTYKDARLHACHHNTYESHSLVHICLH